MPRDNASRRAIPKALAMAAWLLLGVAVVVGVVQVLRAGRRQAFVRIVMPGPVIQGHANIEMACAKCHAPFSKDTQDALCLACHQPVAEDLARGQGFHGRFAPAKNATCNTCHTDHQGRGADIVRLDPAMFHHDATDFPLLGAHAQAGIHCAACHVEGKPFRAASGTCVSCHQQQDVHQGRLGTDCARCHAQTGWKETTFDHSTTRFPLVDKHLAVACYACHRDQTYKNAPLACIACHQVNDVHNSPADERCERCHDVKGWKGATFDHAKTTFPLTGRHTAVSCEACHQGLLFQPRLGERCLACHAGADVHKGRQGPKCEECHTTQRWNQITFNHDRDTTFKLLGRHRDVGCVSCHKTDSREAKLDPQCVSCHQADDVHHGRLGTRCATCHNEQGWGQRVAFDHDLTPFPLIGMHATTSCGACHVSATFTDVSSDCLACHRADDVHKGTLGTLCATCHNPNGWGLWEFDHDTQTTFKLEGKHQGLDCAACHRAPVVGTARLPSACIGCHEKDDVHHGDFGRQCDRCHTVSSFKDVTTGR